MGVENNKYKIQISKPDQSRLGLYKKPLRILNLYISVAKDDKSMFSMFDLKRCIGYAILKVTIGLIMLGNGVIRINLLKDVNFQHLNQYRVLFPKLVLNILIIGLFFYRAACAAACIIAVPAYYSLSGEEWQAVFVQIFCTFCFFLTIYKARQQ